MESILTDNLALLPPEKLERAKELLRIKCASESLPEFITRYFPQQPPPKHTRLLLDLLERARHERLKVCLDWPPRHTKTTMVLRSIPWWLTLYPADTCGYFSYSDRQGRSKSRLARTWAIESGVEMDPRTNDMGEWRTKQGGGLLAGGVGGALTGHGISGIIFIDDPFKNRSEADSLIVRESRWEWLNEVAFTRLEGASVFVIHTRWHEDDIIGRLKSEPGWIHISLPAIAEDNDVLGRAPGEALWPEKFPVDELQAIERQIGAWSYAALYQGRPQPRGSNLFREPARFEIPRTHEEWTKFLAGKYLAIGVDPAASERTHADYSAAVVLARDGLGPTSKTWILDVFRKQCTIPAFVECLRELQKRWHALLVVEAVGGFKAVPQMLRHVDPNLRIFEVKPTVDKFQRAQGVASAWNSGSVLVPVNAPWVDSFLHEVLSFSGVKDPHDDQVDAMAHGWNSLSEAVPRPPRQARRYSGAFG